VRTTALLTDQRFRLHDPGLGHPECPERLQVLETLFDEPAQQRLVRIPARLATEEEISRVHSSSLLESIGASAGRPRTRFDADTAASAKSFDAARLACGGAIDLVDAVLAGEVSNGFIAARPPGHHAEEDRAMGFCLFNTVAVVTAHLLQRRGLARVLIVDWDVHHGNGTQHIFYDDPSVVYVSLHQYPFYPGTGAVDEIGSGAGAGYTVNLPMQAGWGPAEYKAAFREVILPIARRFGPQFVLVSAGFDAHHDDPLAMMRLDEKCFAQMTDAVAEVADEYCQGKLALLLEGGYSLTALPESVEAVLARLAEPQRFADGGAELTAWGEAARRVLAPYWNA
jgi:acetoin utilization deacetylase AcuC-like enzyme